MDEKLKVVIDKIVQLSKQNPEFEDELKKSLGITTFSNNVRTSDKRIENIEKYLGLDYYVDTQPSRIDYSFIQETVIRERLDSDNREMMRFRYGTRYHAVSYKFDEYCRFAHMQAEMLLNYFYNKKNKSIECVIEHIKRFYPEAILKDNIKSLTDISYYSKYRAFNAEFNLNYNTSIILDNLRKIRNESSHRTPENEEKSLYEYKKKLVNMGLPIRPDGLVDIHKLEEGSQKRNLYNNMVKGKDWYTDYKYLIWLHEQPYEKISDALEVLKQTIKDSI